jgi:hypothetical protein
MRRGVYFAALLLTAWTMGLEFAHLLEWPVKATYPGPLYVWLQESLYVWFGNVGSVIYVLAIVASVVVAVLSRTDRGARWLTGVAAGLEIVGLASFFAIIYPVNLRFPVYGTGAVPEDWAGLRVRWEFGHTLGFVLFTAAFALQVLCLLRRTTWKEIAASSSESAA